jgi:hypothetical protein
MVIDKEEEKNGNVGEPSAATVKILEVIELAHHITPSKDMAIKMLAILQQIKPKIRERERRQMLARRNF